MFYRTILLIGSEVIPGKRARCFNEARIGDELPRVNSVTEALFYLKGASAKRDNPVPALVLVWSGVGSDALSELLSGVRNDEHLAHTQIVVLTSAPDPQADIAFAGSPKEFLVRETDTDTLFEVISRHFSENGPFARATQAC